MRIRLVCTRGGNSQWVDDGHAETIERARQMERFGVRWAEVTLAFFVDTLHPDPPFAYQPVEELSVALAELPVAGLAEFLSEFGLVATLLPCDRFISVENGEPFTHSLVLSVDT